MHTFNRQTARPVDRLARAIGRTAKMAWLTVLTVLALTVLAVPRPALASETLAPVIVATLSDNSIGVGETTILTLQITNPSESSLFALSLDGGAFNPIPFPIGVTAGSGAIVADTCGFNVPGFGPGSTEFQAFLTGTIASNATCVLSLELTASAPFHYEFSGFSSQARAFGGNYLTTAHSGAGALDVIAPVPTITGLSPSSGPTTGSTSVTITGTGLLSLEDVKFGSVYASSIDSITDTQIVAQSPPGSAGEVYVTAMTAGGTSATGPASLFTYLPPQPTISSFTPQTYGVLGGDTVVITGTNLSGATAVTFAGQAASGFTIDSATQITATVPAGTAGGTIQVTTPGGVADSADSFSYRSAPSVSGVNPGYGVAGQAALVYGANFTDASSVTFDGVSATIGLVTDTEISVTIPTPVTPLTDQRTVDVVVTTPSGPGTSFNAFTYYGPLASTTTSLPSGAYGGYYLQTLGASGGSGIYSFTLIAGSLPNGLTLDGSGALSGTPSQVGTFPLTVQIHDGFAPVEQILSLVIAAGTGSSSTAELSASTVQIGDTVDLTITVTNASGVDAVAADGVSVTASLVRGLVGYGLGGPLSNSCGGTQTTTNNYLKVQSNIELASGASCTIVHRLTASGAYSLAEDITVSLGKGGALINDASYHLPLMVTDPVPVLTFTTPTSASIAMGGALTNAATSTIPGGGSISYASSDTGVATVGASTGVITTVSAGAATITATQAAVGGVNALATKTYALTVTAAAPTITSLSPANGPLSGTGLSIIGTNLTGTTGVTIGGVAATGVTVVSATQVNIAALAGTAGARDVVLTTPGGTATATGAFTYFDVPTVSGLSPTSGSVAGGDTIVITGSNFTGAALSGASGVRFDTTNATSFAVISDTRIEAVVPARSGAAGSADIVVKTPGGSSSPTPFTYRLRAPTISVTASINPVVEGASTVLTFTLGNPNGPSQNYSGLADTVTLPSGVVVAPTPNAGRSCSSGAVAATAGGSTVSFSNGALNSASSCEFHVSVTSTLGAKTIPTGAPTAFNSLDGVAGTPLMLVGVTVPTPVLTFATPTSASVAMDGSLTNAATSTVPGGGAITYASADTGVATVNLTTGAITPVSVGTSVITATQAASPGVNGVATQTYSLTVTGAAPVITSLARSSGVHLGGTVFYVNGSGFASGSTVSFGGTPATSVTVLSPIQLIVFAPAHAAGPVDLTVTLDGLTSNAVTYTYIVAPTASVDDISVTRLSSGTTTATFTVSLSAAAEEDSNFSIDTFDGTAVQGVDYVRTSTAFYFEAGAQTKSFVVTVNPIATPGPSLTFNAVIRSNSLQGVTVLDGTGVATLVNPNLDPTPTLTFTTPTSASVVMGGARTNAATSTLPSGGAVSYSSASTGVATVNPTTGAVSPVSVGTSVITATQAASPGVNGVATQTYTLTVTAVPTPTLTFATPTSASVVIGGARTNAATSTLPSGGAVSYSSASTGVATVNPTTGAVSPVSVGTSVITATQAASPGVNGVATQTYTLTVTALPTPTLTFATPTSASVVMGGSLTNAATSTIPGGVAISYSSASTGVATVNPKTGAVTPVSVGTSVITATQAASTGVNAVATQTYVLTVTAVPTPTLTFATPTSASVVMGGARTNAATSTLPGGGAITYASASPGVATVNSTTGAVTPVSVGTSVITATQAASAGVNASATQTYVLTVVSAAPTITGMSRHLGGLDGGGALTLTGTGLAGATSVRFGSVAAQGFDVVSDMELRVTAPSGSPGLVEVTVTSAGGVSSTAGAANDYRYLQAATATARFTSAVVAPGGVALLELVITNRDAEQALTAPEVEFVAPANLTFTPSQSQLTGCSGGLAPGASCTLLAAYTAGQAGVGTASVLGRTEAGALIIPTASITIVAAPITSDLVVSVAFNSAGHSLALQPSGSYDSVSLSTLPSHGALSLNGTTATYVPARDYFGPDSFTYVASGPGGTSAAATVGLTVVAPAAPSAAGVAADVAYGSPGQAIALAPSGLFTAVAVVSEPGHGTVSVAGDIATYRPKPDYFGPDSFTYAATGPGGTSAPATVSLTIGLPDPPKAADLSATLAYGAGRLEIALSSSGVTTRLQIDSPPHHGAVTLSGEVATYVPDPDYFGADGFTYVATGPGGASAPARVSLTLTPPPAPTVADLSQGVAYNSSGHEIRLTALGVGASVRLVSMPRHGAVTLSGVVATYRPDVGYFGPDSFLYDAVGPGGPSAPATVTLAVATPPPPSVEAAAPVAVPSPQSDDQAQGSSVALDDRASGVVTGFRISVQARDGHAEIETSQAGASAGPAQDARAAAPAAGLYRLHYTPAPGFMGTDTVTVVATGPGGDSAPAVFTFHVAGKAPDLSARLLSNSVVTLRPTATLTGGPFQGLRITRAPAFGTARVDGLALVFTPSADQGGQTYLDYVVDLPFGSSASGRVTLTSDLVPGTQALTARTEAGRALSVALGQGVVGGPFVAAAVTAIDPAEAATTTLVNTGTSSFPVWTLTFTPKGAFTGVATVRFTLTNAFASTAGTLAVTVEPRPDPALDAELRGLILSQAESARRFAHAQIDNFNRRLEALRDGENDNANDLTLNLPFDAPRAANPGAALDQLLGLDERPFDRAFQQEVQDMARRSPAGWSRSGASLSDPVLPERGAAEGRNSPFGTWVAGGVDWGRRKGEAQRRDYRVTTSGITAGADYQLSKALTFGAGIGYGLDRTQVGSNDSLLEGESWTSALYGAWRAAPALSLSGVLGYGVMDYDQRRWSVAASGFAEGQRSGDMVFGSLSLAYDLEDGPSRGSFYGRFEGEAVSLDAFTEHGVGAYALGYDALEFNSLASVLGVRMNWRLETRRLMFTPALRLEWSHAFERSDSQTVTYADWLASPHYAAPIASWSRDALGLGLEGRWLFNRLDLAAAYQADLGDQTLRQGVRIKLQTKF